MVDEYDDIIDEDPYGRRVRLSRDDFNRIMKYTLQSMGDKDPEVVEYEPEWDEEYNEMKYLSPQQFQDVCEVGIKNYLRSKKSDSN